MGPFSKALTNKNNSMVFEKKSFQSSRRSFKKAKYQKPVAKPKPYRTGKVGIKYSDIARDGAPFPPKKVVNFQYDSPAALVTTIAGQTLQLPIACNSMFDIDRTSASSFGNKQPLYYDTLLSASLYTQYKTTSWDVIFTIVNQGTVPLEVYGVPAFLSTSGWDTISEVSNLPGVSKILLTPAGGSKDKTTIRIRGTPSDVTAGYKDDQQLCASYTGDPASIIYGGILLYTVSGLVAATVSMKGNFRTECFVQTALIS